FNAVSLPGQFTMGDVIGTSQHASAAAGATATWVTEDFLAAHWKPEELDLPPWSPMKGDSAGASLTAASRAHKAGLKIRPLQETVQDTLAWFKTLPAERQEKLHAGLDPQKETETLRLWHADSAHG